ncbi:MAG: arginine--tRNA ligase, partial [Rhodospirillales bacterium]|nr:arginine--tRNA ligase [Rhodospirillales bacterium]
DARQRDHFGMVFQTLRQSGWAPASVRLDHVAFGTVLGPDRRPFKTREGGTVRLIDLLDEAETRALAVIESKATELDAAEKQQVARVVGIGALKYADLSSDRIKDYVFDWDRMLALDGNTAPYLIYSYVRIRSIFRRAEAEGIALPSDDAAIFVNEAAERALVLKLLQLPHVVAGVADALEPHRLCNYLFELAALFHQFFEQCPVLKADGDDIRSSRLRLCDVTARALRASLNMLGIETVERM